MLRFFFFFVKAMLEYFEFISEEEEIWKIYNYYSSRNLNFNVFLFSIFVHFVSNFIFERNKKVIWRIMKL